uniref:Uncharacterized protein n=1 Tax=Salmonella phage PMBT18 TaxID=3229742 RepID=A0AB39BZU2_9CAUD
MILAVAIIDLLYKSDLFITDKKKPDRPDRAMLNHRGDGKTTHSNF